METTEKPRLVMVTDPDELAAMADQPQLARPFLHWFNQGYYADPVELAKWRAGRARTAAEV
jgi:hypothetical protein